MKKCILHIIDQVNCKFKNVDPETRRRMVRALEIDIPYARHTPAFKLGRWSGKISMCTAGGSTHNYLLDRVLPIVIDAGYDIEIEDDRPQYDFQFEPINEFFLADTFWPEGHPFAGERIMMREHQVDAVNTFLSSPHGLQSLPTSAGKTIISAALCKVVERWGRSILVVPSKSLTVQSAADLINAGLDTGLYFGNQKDVGKTHTVATWQSLVSLAKKCREGTSDVTMEEFLDGVVCVMVDEAHSASAKELRDLLTGPLAHIPIRWGFTGTIPKEDHLALSILSALGETLGTIAPKTLMDRGVLANCEIEMLQTEDEVEYPDFASERKYLETDRKRLLWFADYCKSIVNEHGNTLVLVNSIEQGKALVDLCPGSSFVYGNTNLNERSAEFKEFHGSTNKLMFATYGVASCGISIVRVFALVVFEMGRSSTRSIQSLGRALRVGGDKNFAIIKDVSSTAKFSKRHHGKRKAIYSELQYPTTHTKIRYR